MSAIFCAIENLFFFTFPDTASLSLQLPSRSSQITCGYIWQVIITWLVHLGSLARLSLQLLSRSSQITCGYIWQAIITWLVHLVLFNIIMNQGERN